MLQFLPYVGGADLDDEAQLLAGIDSDDDDAMKGAFRPYLIESHRRGWPEDALRGALLELERYATGDPEEAAAEFSSNLFPFQAPRADARLFFRWVHDELLSVIEEARHRAM